MPEGPKCHSGCLACSERAFLKAESTPNVKTTTEKTDLGKISKIPTNIQGELGTRDRTLGVDFDGTRPLDVFIPWPLREKSSISIQIITKLDNNSQ
jgi:hypothetical protein